MAGIRNTVPLQRAGAARQAQLRRAAAHHGHAGGALPRPVRHRVHHRARQAVDAADPGRQAHRRGRVRHRRAARRRGRDRPRRGAAPGHRRAARPADVPALRPDRRPEAARPRRRRLARRGRRHRSSSPPPGPSSGRRGRAGHPGPPGDQPGRPARHDRRAGHPHQPRRQDQSHAAVVARGMGKTCVCGADAIDGRRAGDAVHRRTARPSARATSSPSTAPPAGSTSARCRSSRPQVVQYFEGEPRPGTPTPLVARRAPAPDARRRAAPARRAHQRRHRRGRRPGPPVRRRRASACAAPSTCSSATGGSWSSG